MTPGRVGAQLAGCRAVKLLGTGGVLKSKFEIHIYVHLAEGKFSVPFRNSVMSSDIFTKAVL